MTNNILEAALACAAVGLPVFPCIRNAKTPAIEDFPNRATCDEAQIRQWFTDEARYNLGILMGQPLPGGGFAVAIDLDTKDGKNGAKFLDDKLAQENLPPLSELTFIQRTPTGGVHLIFRSKVLLKTDQNLFNKASGVDVRGRGGYVVGAPSVVNGRRYEVERPPADGIADLGPLEDLLPKPGKGGRPKGSVNSAPKITDAKRAEKRAIAYLQTAPLAIEGQSGDATTFKVAAELKDLGCDEGLAFDLMAAHWNGRCSPPWSDGELRAKVANAYRYGREEMGSRAPEAVFDKVEVQPGAEERESPLQELNRRYAFLMHGSAGTIIEETITARGGIERRFLGVGAFRTYYSNIKIQSGDRAKSLGDEWLSWPGRRAFKRIECYPLHDVPADTLNLWCGFAVTPKAGDWSLMRRHIETAVCGNNPQLIAYVMGWLATCVQRPFERAGVVLALRGQQGTGKSMIANWITEMFGAGVHAQFVSDPQGLVGAFNSHLAQCVFLHADEAFFAGDRKHLGRLKATITEPWLRIEPKGVDSFQVRNCLHILMCSNSDWIVPAAAEERRFVVLDVSTIGKQEDAATGRYFADILAQAASGGVEAMLYDLLRHDLSDFKIRTIPLTTALIEQKQASLDSVDRWLFGLLTGDIELPVSDNAAAFGSPVWGDDPTVLVKKYAQRSYEEATRATGDRYCKGPSALWKRVRQLLGEHVTESRPQGKTADGHRCITFPPRHVAEAVLLKAWGLQSISDVPDIFS